MKGFCIPKNLASKLKEGATRGEFNISEMYSMDSKSRRALFESYVDTSTAIKINSGFEGAMLSSQSNALKRWAENTFIGKESKTNRRADVLKQIDSLQELGALNPANSEGFLQDLVSTGLGATVSEIEVAEITKLADELKVIQKSDIDNGGEPTMEYFVKRRAMQNYLESINPTSNTRVLTSIIGRAAMLLSPKSGIVGIIGNTIQGTLTGIEKRIAMMQFTGSNSQLAREYVKKSVDTFKRSGYDISRMTDLSDIATTLGEEITSSQGPGVIRATGRVFEDIAFNKMLGTPDVFFSAMQRASTADLMSTKIARKEGLTGEALKARARVIMLDALSMAPTTTVGKAIKAQGIADAMYATFTNKSLAAEKALQIRQFFNDGTGDLRLGDLLMPFVKTPANVVSSGLDYMGVGAVRAMIGLPTAITEMKKGNTAPVQVAIRDAVRSGLGLSVAVILANSFDPEEFLGAYPTSAKERELMELQGSTTNSVKIGEKWVSLDYFGPLGAAITGILYANKYGERPEEAIYKYGQGAVNQVLQLPGIDIVRDVISGIDDQVPDGGATMGETANAISNTIIDQLSARLVPAFISDIAKAADNFERETDKNHPLSKLQARIPGLRQSLPIRENIFGESINAQPDWSVLLAGSRLKTANESDVIDELERLKSTGNLPSITDVEKTSSRVKAYKSQVTAEKYDQVIDSYQQRLLEGIEKLIRNNSYERADDEQKSKLINDLKTDILDTELKRGQYKAPRN